jgi:F-type H+-transporting ATPase subunit b
MNGLVLLAQAGGGGPVQEIARTFGVDWTHLVAQIISFGVVCLVLHAFAYRPVLAMLDTRRNEIAQGLANAERIKSELARTETQRQEVMAQANAQMTKLIEEARAAAARLQEQEIQKAIAAAKDIVDKARQATEAEHSRMLAELRCEVGKLVVQTAAAVTGKILTPEDQRRLAEETAKVMAA